MDILPVILAVCGFSVVCLGILAVAAFVFAKTLGTRIPFVFNMLGNREEDDIEEEIITPRRVRSQTSSAFQTKPQDLDFDSAVDRYRRKFNKTEPEPKAAPFTSPSSTDLSDHDVPSIHSSGFPRDRRWGRVDSNAYDDEVYGGLLDEADVDMDIDPDDGLI